VTYSTLADDQLISLVNAAILAPSSHNTQPWLFRIVDTRLDLLADRTRALPVNDPEDRELTISCGCALFNLCIAAAAAGLRVSVVSAPDATDPDLLASLQFAPSIQPLELADLMAAISARRTYRERFAELLVDAATCQALIDGATAEGASLTLLEGDTRRGVAASLVAEGDAIQWANPSWRRELAAWMHPRRRGDGLSLPALAVPLAQAVVRTFNLGHGVAARDQEIAEGSPLLAILSTEGDTTRDWLAAGQALQRVLLVGVRYGLQASFLNQPVQVATLRPTLQQLTKRSGYAQVLLRMGFASNAIAASVRRPLSDVLIAP
jgi:nitroreductase